MRRVEGGQGNSDIPVYKGIRQHLTSQLAGFIAPENGEKDVFVHATALTRSGLSLLVEGQKVFVECGQGKKGLEVRSVRLA